MTRRTCTQAGFTYLGVIAAVALVGAALAATGEVWHVVAKREREKELLFVGAQFRRAIESYYFASPGRLKKYPRAFSDLVLDARFPQTVRHLRRAYRDPVTGSEEWGIVTAPDGGILGVYSLSSGRPLKRAQFDPRDARFAGAQQYSDWKFVASIDGAPPVIHAGAN